MRIGDPVTSLQAALKASKELNLELNLTPNTPPTTFPDAPGNVELWQQTFGSTTLGFGGVGCRALSVGDVVVLYDDQSPPMEARVYVNGRLAHRVRRPNYRFYGGVRDRDINGAGSDTKIYEDYEVTLGLASDFSRYPGGRYKTDGPYSGEEFREGILVPALRDYCKVTIELGGTFGNPASFLDEAFGGLVRKHGYTADELMSRLTLKGQRAEDTQRVWQYIAEA